MEEPDRITLQYQMLEYLFSKCKLATSCYNYTWEDFLNEYTEYRNVITDSTLKEIFWTEIVPNIEEYELLTEEQKVYFDRDGLILDVSDENLSTTLFNNEPKKDVDYIVNPEAGQTHLRLRPTYDNIRKMFNQPDVCEETDIILNIFTDKLPVEVKPDNRFNIKCLQIALLAETDQTMNSITLSDEEIIRRLRNSNILSGRDHFGIFNETLKKEIEALQRTVREKPEELRLDIGSSRNSLDTLPSIGKSLSVPSIEQSRSSISILNPQVSSTPTRSMTRSLSQTTPSSRRRALDRSKSITPNRNLRTRRILVPDPALNLKMSQFMNKRK